MISMKTFSAAICTCMMLTPICASAQDLSYQPINPRFGGNPFNSNHLLGEMLMRDSGIKLQHIPYEGGSAAVLDLMRGETDMMFYSLSQFQPGLQTNELTLLAITADQRSVFTPELPTMKELGYDDVMVSSWYALFAPKGTDSAQIDKLFAALNQALADPEVVAALEKTGTEVWKSESPQEFSEFLTAERNRYGELIDAIGLEKR